jgi:Zn finger protein HypA/HybF involved in hydrogenase expression
MHSAIDPYDPEVSLYECYDCGHHKKSTVHLAICSECGGSMKNIAVPRE